MAVNYKDIPELLKMNNLDYWRVRRFNKNDDFDYSEENESKHDSALIFKSDPALSFDENIENYLKTLKLNGKARYTLDASQLRGKDKSRADMRGCSTWDIYVENETGFERETSAPVVAEPSPQVGTVSKDYFDKMLEIQRKEILADFLEKDLQRRESILQEEQREWNRTKNDAIEIGLQKLGSILPKIMPEMAKVAGTAKPEIIRMDTANTLPERAGELSKQDGEQEERDVSREVEDLLNMWANIDPDWFKYLEKIVELAQTNPQKYQTAKMFL